MLREPAGDGDWEQYAIAAAEAFGGKRDAWTAFVEPMRANGRALVAVDGGRVVAGATVLPVAQHFGGRPVRSGAISNVFVLPGHRGQGLSGAVLDGLGPLLAGAGPVSVLSTGSPGVYRPHDWEIGGVRAPVTIPGRVLAELGPAGGTLVREPALAERAPLAARLAAAWDGPMSRPAWWEELTEVWLGARPAQRAGWREDGRLTGWLAVEPRDDRLVVSEWWTSTPDAVAGLAGFLGAGRPFPKEVRFDTGTLPPDAELLHTPAGLGRPRRAQPHLDATPDRPGRRARRPRLAARSRASGGAGDHLGPASGRAAGPRDRGRRGRRHGGRGGHGAGRGRCAGRLVRGRAAVATGGRARVGDRPGTGPGRARRGDRRPRHVAARALLTALR